MVDLLALLGLFTTCLAAGSIVPVPSEAAFVAALLGSDINPWLLLLVASVGNLAGSTINWLIGRGAGRFEGRAWFPVSPAALDRARGWYHRYGRWSLLISWVPLVGDPLTIAAGLMREPLRFFVPIVFVAKLARYAMLMAITLNIG
jgi:membrane protein YqaA with SNARE-associated domain